MIKKLQALLCLFLCFQALSGQTVFKDYVDGEIYVKFKAPALKKIMRLDPMNIPVSTFEHFKNCFSRYGVTKISRPFYQADDDASLPNILKISFTAIGGVSGFIKELEAQGSVIYAEKVPLMRSFALPNDPVFPPHLTQINASAAWNIFNGNSNITVAIVDDAIMWNHVDLSANIYINPGEIANNGIDDENNGYVDDVHGYDVTDLDNNPAPTNTLMSHGTHCAGIAGARTDNAIGIASIGWNIKIIPVKCQSDGGSVTGISNGFEGIIYATKAKARVISCSWGGAGFAVTSQAAVDYAWARGSLVIAAAGNSGNSTQNYPGAYNNVYCVASVGSSDIRSGFSNFGTWVDIAAPGESINSTVPYTGSPVYQQMSGTSMATPLVAGLAGLMLSKSPQMTPTDVMNCISSTAANIYTLSGNSSYVSGHQLGAGRIDAFQAMSCAVGFLSHPPVANFYAIPNRSCPNTPVQFSDSSLYAPTSWAWTFQGGTPATSSASNPAVQWPTTGVYSVSLTVSNANGNSTVTRTGYVTVAAPSASFLSEGFQGSQFLPAGWIPINFGNDEIYWQRKTGTGGFGTSTACAMFDNFTYNTAGDRDEMRTPAYDLSHVAAARLRFDVAYARYDAVNSDSLEVKLSTNCGASWTSIYLKGGTTLATAPDASSQFVPNVSQWRTDSIDISSLTAGQGSVLFSFINHGQYGQPLYLDNINLAFPLPAIMIHSGDSVCAGSAYTFYNMTMGATAYTWDLPGANPPNSSVANPTVSYSSPGTYPVNLIASNGPIGDTLGWFIHVIAIPSASVAVSNASCSTCSDGTLEAVTLGGPAPFSYTWLPAGGNSAVASGLSPGCYTVSIQGGNGCVFATPACVGSGIGTGVQGLAGAEEEIAVYPNPAKDQLNVDCSVPFSYSLFNAAGQLILKNSANPYDIINLDKFAAGMYMLELRSDSKILRKKIIIE